MILQHELRDSDDELPSSTVITIDIENQSIDIHPHGHNICDGEYAPIIIERSHGRIRLLYWPDINNEEPVIVDMSGALESARTHE